MHAGPCMPVHVCSMQHACRFMHAGSCMPVHASCCWCVRAHGARTVKMPGQFRVKKVWLAKCTCLKFSMFVYLNLAIYCVAQIRYYLYYKSTYL
jgi:hypothetical protein